MHSDGRGVLYSDDRCRIGVRSVSHWCRFDVGWASDRCRIGVGGGVISTTHLSDSVAADHLGPEGHTEARKPAVCALTQ